MASGLEPDSEFDPILAEILPCWRPCFGRAARLETGTCAYVHLPQSARFAFEPCDTSFSKEKVVAIPVRLVGVTYSGARRIRLSRREVFGEFVRIVIRM